MKNRKPLLRQLEGAKDMCHDMYIMKPSYIKNHIRAAAGRGASWGSEGL